MPPHITYYVACSADGYIADADGGIGWLDNFQGAGEDYGYKEFFDSMDGLVMGRKTYEQIRGFGSWPYGEKPCWVFSRQEIEVGENIIAVDTIDSLLHAKQCEEGSVERLWLVGGGALAGWFASQNLINRCMIFVMPCLLGNGIPLFGAEGVQTTGGPAMLQLDQSVRYTNGVVQLDYRFPHSG